MNTYKSKIVQGCCWGAFAIAAYCLTFEFNQPLGHYRYGATGWPRLIITAMFLCAFVQVATGLYHTYRTKDEEKQDGPLSSSADSSPVLFKKRIMTFVIPILYALLLPYTGFFGTTPIFLAAYMLLLGERRWNYILAVTFFVYGLILFVFVKLLYTPLPIGTWPGFYEISNYITYLLT